MNYEKFRDRVKGIRSQTKMFEPRQIFSIVFDDDGTRTIYKVNRLEKFLSLNRKKPSSRSIIVRFRENIMSEATHFSGTGNCSPMSNSHTNAGRSTEFLIASRCQAIS